MPVPIGGLTQSTNEVVNGVSGPNTKIWYAGTGVGDLALDSKPGIGVLKSVDNGKTWVVAGNSGTVLKGARIVKMVVNASDANFV